MKRPRHYAGKKLPQCLCSFSWHTWALFRYTLFPFPQRPPFPPPLPPPPTRPGFRFLVYCLLFGSQAPHLYLRQQK